MSPLDASFALFGLWVVSWFIAALWSKPAAARPSIFEELANRFPTVVGYALIFFGAHTRLGLDYHPIAGQRLWVLEGAAGWILTAGCLTGFAFTWWARIHLGALWSGSVTRKDDHHIIESGPYGLVRHPIYTGLLLATLAIVIQIGTAAALAGFVLATLGFWLKARLEERFLSQQLGEESYADYRRRTPMLIPFWPMRG